MSLLVTVFVNVLLTGIWGGFGTEGASVLRFLQDHAGIMPLPAMLAAAVLLTLYLFDFFWPPHLLGRYCQLWEGDSPPLRRGQLVPPIAVGTDLYTGTWRLRLSF